VARSLFLTTQEALANIARHGKASQVYISLTRENEHAIALRIRDDGVGFDVQSKNYSVGHGLSNMRARAEDLNGSFEITSVPGEGTAILLVLPIKN
jgi:signal transduction histidine kinase